MPASSRARSSARGVGPGDPGRASPMERGVDLVVGIIGFRAAGGAYIPLVPVYGRCRLAFMLEDARVPVVVTSRPATPTSSSPGLGAPPRRRRRSGSPARPKAALDAAAGAPLPRPPTSPMSSTLRAPPGKLQGRHGRAPRRPVPALPRHRTPGTRFHAGRRVDACSTSVRLRLLRLGVCGRASSTAGAARGRAARWVARSPDAFLLALLIDEQVTVLNQHAETAMLSAVLPRPGGGRSDPWRRARRWPCATSSSAARPSAWPTSRPSGTGTATSAPRWSTGTASPRRPCTSPTGRCAAPTCVAGLVQRHRGADPRPLAPRPRSPPGKPVPVGGPRRGCTWAAPAPPAATCAGPSSPPSASSTIRSTPGPEAASIRTGDRARRLDDRRHRVPRAHRPAGQDSRLPHRARGNRRRPSPSTRPCASRW